MTPRRALQDVLDTLLVTPRNYRIHQLGRRAWSALAEFWVFGFATFGTDFEMAWAQTPHPSRSALHEVRCCSERSIIQEHQEKAVFVTAHCWLAKRLNEAFDCLINSDRNNTTAGHSTCFKLSHL